MSAINVFNMCVPLYIYMLEQHKNNDYCSCIEIHNEYSKDIECKKH